MQEHQLRALSPGECRAHLQPGGIGRLGVSIDALPAILPVRFAMLDLDVVFRAAPGTILANAVSNAVVAFEADSLTDPQRQAWSVLVVGHAEIIEDPHRHARAQRLPLVAWRSNSTDQFARIPSDVISGCSYLRR